MYGVLWDNDTVIIFILSHGHNLLWHQSSNFSISLNTCYVWQPTFWFLVKIAISSVYLVYLSLWNFKILDISLENIPFYFNVLFYFNLLFCEFGNIKHLKWINANEIAVVIAKTFSMLGTVVWLKTIQHFFINFIACLNFSDSGFIEK